MLLTAFACAPDRGSEPGLAWGYLQKAATRHEVWVLTNAHNRPLIETALARRPLPKVHFVYLAPPLFKKMAYRSPWSHYLYYATWQVEAFRMAKRLHREVSFDVVHHLTYVNAWIPSFLGWVGPPFIWTAGNVERIPWSFIRAMTWRGKLEETLRNLALSLGFPVAKLLAARRAALILSASLPERWGTKLPVQHFPLGGLTEEDLALIPKAETLSQEALFRVISVGRMLPLKGFDLGLRAFAQFHQRFTKSEYWLIGEGPERPRLEALARRLGIIGAVRFLGQVPRDEVFKHLAKASVLLHPSLRESLPYAVVEALAAGVPAICLDVGGVSRLVQEGVGIKVKAQTPRQVVESLSESMYALALDPERRAAMGELAQHYTRRDWTWQTVGESLLGFYDEVTR